ncbi:MAG: hypothetical protein EXR72_18420 [Myxococcales bacterium]|nr:hypothetical protein [Myxococcales bacterium]
MDRPFLSAACALLLGAGCGLFPPTATDGGSDGGSGKGDAAMAHGFGKPTVEVTVAGKHFGPSVPDPGSRADLITTRDSVTRRVTGSSFGVIAASAQSGASCSIGVKRSGDDVAPVGVGGWQLVAASFGRTADGTVVPLSDESASTPQGTWRCSGAQCNGAAFVITELDSAHAEGYLAGRFASVAGGGYADVVCAFWVPMGTYQP